MDGKPLFVVIKNRIPHLPLASSGGKSAPLTHSHFVVPASPKGTKYHDASSQRFRMERGQNDLTHDLVRSLSSRQPKRLKMMIFQCVLVCSTVDITQVFPSHSRMTCDDGANRIQSSKLEREGGSEKELQNTKLCRR